MTTELDPAVTIADLPSTQGVADLAGQTMLASVVTIYYTQFEQDEDGVNCQDETNTDYECELDGSSGNVGEI